MLKPFLKTGLTAALTTLLIACGGDSDSNSADQASALNLNDCFWQGPYSIENPASNFAYPDTGTTYWSTRYTLPEGATLKLNGEFPYARYMSLNSYRADASPADAISDAEIIPAQGAINPFINGNERYSEFRDYSLTLAAGETPEQQADNTLYDNAADGQAVLLYRVYVPDNGKSISGGVDLPEPELTTADGQTLSGQAACDALKNVQGLEDTPFVPADTYAKARQNNPAKTEPLWKAAYNFSYSLYCGFFRACDPTPERQVPWFANLDNQYMSSFIDRNIKPVVVIRGRIPNVPKTLNGAATFDNSDAQLRYWSICQNEYYSQKVTACLYDEEITINPDGQFTIVTSLEKDRPANAIEKCGVGYLKWSEDGDGFGIIEGRENAETDGLLIIRNMLPVNGFEKTIQNTQVPGDEADVLAEFMPTTQYMTKLEFEALGCDPYTAL